MALELRNLGKRFDDIVAVDDLSLSAEDEDFLVLVGPSGSGKSTTLRMIAGLETPSEGEILIDGEVANNRDPADRDIAMVFQDYALYPHMTVRENMGLSLKVKGVPKEQFQEKVKEAAQLLGIEELLERKPSELSGGQQQRVALGRSIVRDPAVFLMDEPLSNLDAKLRLEMRRELEKLHQRLETTFVYVTHDQEEAMTLGDKIAVLNHGKLQQLGTPEELYDNPANEFVAGFIGSPSMNIYDCDIIDRGNLPAIEFGDVRYPLNDELADAINWSDVGSLRFGIRPEDVRVSKNGEYTATVDVLEPVGGQVIAYLQLEGIDVTIKTTRDGTLNEGDQIRLDFPRENVHLFADGKAVR